MLNQMELIEAARDAITAKEGRAERVSYYRISKELGVTSAYMSEVRRGRYLISAELAHKLALLSGTDPAYAMASIEAERASRADLDSSGTWRALAESLGKNIAARILLAGLSLGAVVMAPSPASAQALSSGDGSATSRIRYIM